MAAPKPLELTLPADDADAVLVLRVVIKGCNKKRHEITDTDIQKAADSLGSDTARMKAQCDRANALLDDLENAKIIVR